jgi:hypothetical protein
VVIRNVLTYAALNWHEIRRSLKKLSKTFILIQNKCLQIVNSAYKAILARYLESEIAIPLLDLYFDRWVANFKNRTEVFGTARFLRTAGAKAAELATNKPENRSRRRRAIAAQIKRDKKSQAIRE